MDYTALFGEMLFETVKHAGECAVEGIKSAPQKLRSVPSKIKSTFKPRSFEEITGKTPEEHFDEVYGSHHYTKEQIEESIKNMF